MKKITIVQELSPVIDKNTNEKSFELKTKRLVKRNSEIINFFMGLFDLK